MGYGLLSAENTVASEYVALYHYLKDYTDVLMKKMLFSVVPEAFKHHLNVTHF